MEVGEMERILAGAGDGGGVKAANPDMNTSVAAAGYQRFRASKQVAPPRENLPDPRVQSASAGTANGSGDGSGSSIGSLYGASGTASSYRPTAEVTADVNDPTGGAFFDPSSTTDKGRHRLQDAREFDTDTLHRRSDVLHEGVSLLMGVKRAPIGKPGGGRRREEVITVMFDRSEFTERDAKGWWLENKERIL